MRWPFRGRRLDVENALARLCFTGHFHLRAIPQDDVLCATFPVLRRIRAAQQFEQRLVSVREKKGVVLVTFELAEVEKRDCDDLSLPVQKPRAQDA